MPVKFGQTCPHCKAGGQVPGMKCLNCGRHIFTVGQKILIVIILLAVVVGLILLGLPYTG